MRLEDIRALRRPTEYVNYYVLTNLELDDFLKEVGCDLKFPHLIRYIEDARRRFGILKINSLGRVEPWYYEDMIRIDFLNPIQEIIHREAVKETDALIEWIEENILRVE